MQMKHLPCFAHTLNLIVQEALRNTNEVKKTQEKIKHIVSYFHHSVKAVDKLGEIQDQKGIHHKKLIWTLTPGGIPLFI